MKIRTQGIIAIILITVIFFVALFTVAVFVIQPSFDDLEKEQANQGLVQTKNAINYDISQIGGNLVGYSAWDDTYNFVQNNNRAYVDLNFIDSTFESLGLNLVAIVNNSNSLVYCQSFDRINSVKVQTSNETEQILTSDNKLWAFSSFNSTISGLMLVDNEPMIVVTAPILTSLYQGPSMGRMLFGRYLDAAEISQLEGITSLNFSVNIISNLKANNSQIADSLLANQQASITKEENANFITDYLVINDVNSNPSFVLQVSQERTVYHQGVWVEDIFLVAAISLTIALGIAISVLLEIGVVKPMTKLASQIEKMPLNPKNSESKSKFETDEMKILSNSAKNNLNKKFEAMTEVSRMVGHDLRNPLAGIKNATYILKKNYGSRLEEKGNAQLKTIDDCVEYSDKIVRDLLDYSCEIKIDKIKTDAKTLVDASLSALVLPSNIRVQNEVAAGFSLMVDTGQIQRVFSNIVKNAFDAMPNGGKLQITSEKANGLVAIDFSDSGMGMSEETLKKVWTPFFTTKAKGMGVGLSICKKIIEAHGGRIEVKSTFGKGTSFTIFLPIGKN